MTKPPIPEPTRRGRKPRMTPLQCNEDCRVVASVLALIGDKWSVLIITKLSAGTMRFNEIKRMVGGISQRMLTRTLRGLEREGLVQRIAHPTVPPRVDYRLTTLGGSLWRVLNPLGEWARAHVDDLRDARASFDDEIVPSDGEAGSRLAGSPRDATQGYEVRGGVTGRSNRN